MTPTIQKNPTISIKQAKALHNKAKGLTVCAYNKAAEISTSGKDYILGYYGNRKRLYRLEINNILPLFLMASALKVAVLNMFCSKYGYPGVELPFR